MAESDDGRILLKNSNTCVWLYWTTARLYITRSSTDHLSLKLWQSIISTILIRYSLCSANTPLLLPKMLTNK